MIEASGARLMFLPAYSPDLNPIENAFAKIKSVLRKAERRSFDAICQCLGRHLNRFNPEECANYFANAGYGSI
jgi:transposase